MSPPGLALEKLSTMAQVAFRGRSTHCCLRQPRSMMGKQRHICLYFVPFFFYKMQQATQVKSFLFGSDK